MNNATKDQIIAAFTEWERRFREDPSSFYSEQEKAALSCDTYGDLCAPYFLKILGEIQKQ